MEHNLYMVQTVVNNIVSNVVVYMDGDIVKVNKYTNGISSSSAKLFERINLDDELFVGETSDNLPSGWGILFQRDGQMWYGKWADGKRNGIGGYCDFDGSDYKVGVWKNNNLII